MIDRAKLTLYNFCLKEPENFVDDNNNHPPMIDTLSSNATYDKPAFGKYATFHLQHSKVITANGYIPNLTIKINPNSRFPYRLIIEWCPNKAVYGHNFYELADHQFEEMITATVELLADCGVIIHPFYLANCTKIGQIDYGSNIPVTALSANKIISILNSGFEKNSRYDKLSEQYQKIFSGSQLTYSNKAQRLTFYNKVAEVLAVLDNPLKAESELYQFAIQLRHSIEANPFEVLRVEHRLLKHTAIDRELCKLIGHTQPFTFREIYSSKVRVAILRKHLGQVLGKGKIKTYALGELEPVAIKSLLNQARYQLDYHKLNPIWYQYPSVFRNQGEKAARELIANTLPKATLERGLNHWQELMKLIELEHPLLTAEAEIYQRLEQPEPLNQVPDSQLVSLMY